MFQLVEFLKKRPSDLTIRLIRALLSIGMATILIYAIHQYTLPLESKYIAYADYAKYAIAAIFVLHALIFGGIGICFCKRGLMKKIQMASGLGMIVLGSFIAPTIPTNNTNLTRCIDSVNSNTRCVDSVSVSEAAKSTSAPIHVGGWMVLYGVFALLAGVSGKMVTSKCLKHGEIITKIRV